MNDKAKPDLRDRLLSMLLHARVSLAGAILSGERFIQAAQLRGFPGRATQFRGVPVDEIEKHSFLVFLARAEDLLEAARRAGASEEFADHVRRFSERLGHAEDLRNMSEHVGGNKHPELLEASWPPADIVSRSGSRIAAGAVVTRGPATTVFVQRDDHLGKTQVMIGSRLEAREAVEVATTTLEAVSRELARVEAVKEVESGPK